jgi:hypothetical protein
VEIFIFFSALREVDIRIERINPTNGIGIATTIDSDERVLLHSHAFPNERLFDVISSVTIDPSMYLVRMFIYLESLMIM